jgi:hypothetical protein
MRLELLHTRESISESGALRRVVGSALIEARTGGRAREESHRWSDSLRRMDTRVSGFHA